VIQAVVDQAEPDDLLRLLRVATYGQHVDDPDLDGMGEGCFWGFSLNWMGCGLGLRRGSELARC